MIKALILYGPTAVGKTELAINLAKKYNGELISADSRQVYKELDIGTGKVNFDAKVEKHGGYWIVDGIRINGFDLVDPPSREPGSQEYPEPGSEQYIFSAAGFVKFASTTMIRIIEDKKSPIVVGGTGFYIKALIEGIDTIGIPADFKLRQKLEKISVISLYNKLMKLDLERAHKMNESDRKNPRRLIRAIEVALSQKSDFTPGVRKVASRHTPGVSHEGGRPTTNYQLIGLTAPNQYLYQRADKWLEIRLKKGMIEEIKLLLTKVDPVWLENLGLEYRWITKYLLGEINLLYAKERLMGDIHSFIRRQKTFFNQFEQIETYDISKKDWLKKLEKSVGLWYTFKNGY